MNERLHQTLVAIDGVEEAPSRYQDGPALWVNGTEIAHYEPDNVVDIRLTRAIIRSRRGELRALPSVSLRPSSSDWLWLQVTTAEDERLLIGLVEEAVAAHRAAPGTIPSPPGP